jgi:hypothetical protein
MKKEDEYIIEDNGFNFIFKKNGVRHREAGPALFWKANVNKEQLLNLNDKHLYKLVHLDLTSHDKDFLSRAEDRVDLNEVYYYVEGKKYSQQEFETIKLKLILKTELTEDLNNQKDNVIKKLKL